MVLPGMSFVAVSGRKMRAECFPCALFVEAVHLSHGTTWLRTIIRHTVRLHPSDRAPAGVTERAVVWACVARWVCWEPAARLVLWVVSAVQLAGCACVCEVWVVHGRGVSAGVSSVCVCGVA